MSHRHQADRCRDNLPYQGPVSRDQNPAAHGDRRVVQDCRCGMQRQINYNGPHEEVGPWYRPA